MKSISTLLLLFSCSTVLSSTPEKAHFAKKIHSEMQTHFTSASQQISCKHIALDDRKYMTGNWRGFRSKLAEKGLTIESSFYSDDAVNVSGGQHRGVAYTGSWGTSLNFDFEKMFEFKGFSFYASIVQRSGTSLSDKIGNQFPVAQIYGGQNFRVNEVYFAKKWDAIPLQIKIGRLDAGNDFLQSPLYYNFVSNAFDGNPIGIFFNQAFSAYPNATWGAVARYDGDILIAKIAVYNANNTLSTNRYHGLNWTFSSTDGAQISSELGFKTNFQHAHKKLSGHYRLGMLYFNKEKEHFISGKSSYNATYYALLDQELLNVGKEGKLTSFVSLLFAPANRNTFPFFTSSGLILSGWVESRPKDTTSLGFAYGKYSKDLVRLQRDNIRTGAMNKFGQIPQNFESVIELTHAFWVYPWFVIQPDIQYITKPKGNDAITNSTVLGAQFGFIF